MKKKGIIAIILLVASFTYSNGCHAQFLKKLGKSIEKASKQVDKVLGTEESAGQNEIQNNTPKMTVTTPHKNLLLNFTGASMSGERYILEFTITNKGDDIKDYRLSGQGSGSADAYDDLGNQCRVDVIFGRNESWHGGTAGGNLLNDTPVKITILLSRFGSKAASFSQIRIKGETWDHGYTDRPDGNFVFKNVPIVREKEQGVVIPVEETNTDNSVNTNTSSQTVVEKQALQAVSIPKAKFGMKYWNQAERNKYIKGEKITQQERLLLKLDNVKGRVFKQIKNNQIVRGETIYSGKNGRIESIVVVYDLPGEGQELFEYLISYDSRGNYIDLLQVGEKRLYYTNDIYAIIEDSIITVTNYYADAGDEETIIAKYKVSPRLTFNQIK